MRKLDPPPADRAEEFLQVHFPHHPAAVIALHLAGAVHFDIPVWYGLLFPLGYTTGALIALDSVRWRLRGRVVWKGRSYQ